MKKIAMSLLTLSTALVFAAPPHEGSPEIKKSPKPMKRENPWYGYINTGYAWTMKAGVSNPDSSIWDASNQGYDKNLTDGSFFGLGFGKQLWSFLDFDFEYAFYKTFIYQKHQNGSSSTPGFTGNHRTRFFDVDTQSLLFNLRLHPPRGCFEMMLCDVAINPFVGAGMGVGINQVSNFYTVGFNSASGVGSTTSIGDPNTRTSFAWQANAGFSIRPKHTPVSLDLFYRYFDSGRFEGPNRVVENTSDGNGHFGSTIPPFKGKVKTNQIVISLRIEG